jgi:4-hydroxythreonine-4-phosphate dehydrogenase
VKPIAITLGDPAGIGSEVVFKAIAELDPAIPVRIFGDRQFATQAPEFRPQLITGNRAFSDVSLSDSTPLQFGTIDARYGRVALASIEAAVSAIERGECSALVTAPIHKQSIAAAGALFPGHTELLASRAGLSRYGFDYAMYFDSPSLKVSLLSVHEPLAAAIAKFDSVKIAALIHLTRTEYRRLYSADPRIAVAGVNPHAGEDGLFGDQEDDIAIGIEAARLDGADVSGPHAPDTVFLRASRGDFDVVIAMYHDQGLIPVKTLDFEHSVNVTLGLPYLRCSVDHGTAFDIAGKGVANHKPMLYAIQWAARYAEKPETRNQKPEKERK